MRAYLVTVESVALDGARVFGMVEVGARSREDAMAVAEGMGHRAVGAEPIVQWILDYDRNREN